METITGTNPQPQGDSVEALAARLKQAELNPDAAKAHVVGGKAASEVQAQTQTKPPEAMTPPPDGTKEGLPQTTDKGEVSLSEIQKRNEHLEKGIKEKEELLKRNKELLAKFHQTSQEASKTGKQLGAVQSVPEGGQGQEIDDKRFLDALAKSNEDPLVLKKLFSEMAEAAAERKFGPALSEWQKAKQDDVWSGYGEELVALAKAGNTWIATEGLERFERVFQEKPFLLKSPTPYMDAMRFIDAPIGPAAVPAQNGKPAPILGGGSAVPPPSSAPAATTEQKMADLSIKFREAARWNDRKVMSEIMEQMNRLERGR